MVLNDCMSQYENFITKKKYLKAMLFIISIITSSIMIFLIWLWLKITNIIQITKKNDIKKTQRNKISISILSDE